MFGSVLRALIGPPTLHMMLRLSLPVAVVLAGTWLGVFACPSAQAAVPKRVQLIYSFGRGIAPYDAIASVFRTELARRSAERIVLSEATLDAGRPVTQEEEAFFRYLQARFAATAQHLVVTIGPPAALFCIAHRDRLFPAGLPRRRRAPAIAAVRPRLVRDTGRQ